MHVSGAVSVYYSSFEEEEEKIELCCSDFGWSLKEGCVGLLVYSKFFQSSSVDMNTPVTPTHLITTFITLKTVFTGLHTSDVDAGTSRAHEQHFKASTHTGIWFSTSVNSQRKKHTFICYFTLLPLMLVMMSFSVTSIGGRSLRTPSWRRRDAWSSSSRYKARVCLLYHSPPFTEVPANMAFTLLLYCFVHSYFQTLKLVTLVKDIWPGRCTVLRR